jgi:hypothetical protein
MQQSIRIQNNLDLPQNCDFYVRVEVLEGNKE